MNNIGEHIQVIVSSADPACTKCHGRGMTCSQWSENQSPLGSGLYWPEYVYEEDFCSCIPDAIAHEIDITPDTWNDESIYYLAHWGCKQCALNELAERRMDDGMALNSGIGYIQEWLSRIVLELRAIEPNDSYAFQENAKVAAKFEEVVAKIGGLQ